MEEEALKGIEHMRKTDHYRLLQFRPGHFRFIMDVGAYIGYFSLWARELHPEAKIVAVEGVSDPTFKRLLANTVSTGIVCVGEVMGNGQFLSLQHGRGVQHMFRWAGADGMEMMSGRPSGFYLKTKTLGTLFHEHYESGPYFLKFNCEGAERFLIGDSIAEEIISGADGVGIQIHFPCEKNPWPDWLPFEEHRDWIKGRFSKTHEIKYHDSRVKQGYGHFTMVRRGTGGIL